MLSLKFSSSFSFTPPSTHLAIAFWYWAWHHQTGRVSELANVCTQTRELSSVRQGLAPGYTSTELGMEKAFFCLNLNHELAFASNRKVAYVRKWKYKSKDIESLDNRRSCFWVEWYMRVLAFDFAWKNSTQIAISEHLIESLLKNYSINDRK